MEKVTFLVGNACNFRCKHCFVSAGTKKSNEMNLKEKYMAIDKLKGLGVKKISFSGGEPLMDKNIFEYVEYAKNKRFDIGFLTNGLLLDDEKIKKLVELRINSLSISLYTSDIIEMNSVNYLEYKRKMINSLKKISSTSLKYKITIPVSNNSIEKVYELLKMLIDNKVFPLMVRIYIITPVGRGKENSNMCTHNLDLSEFFERLPSEIKESDLNISVEYTDISDNEECTNICDKCQLLKYENNYINKYGDPHMDVNGDLYLCGLLLRKKEFCIGNILKDTKDEIFYNIERVVGRIKNETKVDPCPVLNRKKRGGKKLVCPIIYERVKN